MSVLTPNYMNNIILKAQVFIKMSKVLILYKNISLRSIRVSAPPKPSAPLATWYPRELPPYPGEEICAPQ
jgi:hypothetical protein